MQILPEDSIRKILEYIGEDPKREGLIDTPSRVLKSYKEIFSGYKMDISSIFNKKFFEVPSFSDYIWLKNIEFNSVCEHHMLPISGTVDICYIPNKVIVGLSKLARIVDAFSKRLQLQERMTVQIAESIQEHLDPLGVGVRVKAIHYCMIMRGVNKNSSTMETTHFTKIFKENDNNKRKEFFYNLNNS